MQILSYIDLKMWDFINDCRSLHNISLSACKNLISIRVSNRINYEALHKIELEIKSVAESYFQMVRSDAEIYSKMYSESEYDLRFYNYQMWINRNKVQYDDLLHCIRTVILKLLKLYEERYLVVALRLISFYNNLIDLNLSVNVDVMYASSSSCPIVQNKKKFTISRILKILAFSRAETCAANLIDFLMKRFVDIDNIQKESPIHVEENYLSNFDYDLRAESDSTTVVVFKKLNQHMIPSMNVPPTVNYSSVLVPLDWELIQTEMTNIVSFERNKLNTFFSALLAEWTDLLSENKVKLSKKSGRIKLRESVQREMFENYEYVLWQNSGLFCEHMLLWWKDECLGKKNPLIARKFNAWLKQYQATENVDEILRPTMNSLIDCLCSYVTSTSWDELFRQALISADYQHTRHEVQDIGLGTRTGQLFSDLLHGSVVLVNSCEGFNQDILDTENLPIAEQITVLHRLDHSLHKARLWFLSRAKYLSNCWNMEQFFRVTHVDVSASLYALSKLKLPSDKEDPHFSMCSKMRMKLISEVNGNIKKLQNVPKESLFILSSVCRITSLAYLKISFPDSFYWQQQHENQPSAISAYVGKYLDEILKPVLLASQNLTSPIQKSVSRLVLEIMCEAWLDHIYKYRIKFSEWGAVQLLTDFGAIPDWIQEKVLVSDDIRKFLKTSEILRRCEGVGRLLLRHPGESIIMNCKKSIPKESSTYENIEALMPPEMYVPNQKIWLQLRLNKRKASMTVCCKS